MDAGLDCIQYCYRKKCQKVTGACCFGAPILNEQAEHSWCPPVFSRLPGQSPVLFAIHHPEDERDIQFAFGHGCKFYGKINAASCRCGTSSSTSSAKSGIQRGRITLDADVIQADDFVIPRIRKCKYVAAFCCWQLRSNDLDLLQREDPPAHIERLVHLPLITRLRIVTRIEIKGN